MNVVVNMNDGARILSPIEQSIENFQNSLPHRNYRITKGSIKDGICDYSFETTEGTFRGESGTIKGPGMMKDSLIDAVLRLRVHLAWMDGAFNRDEVKVFDDLLADEEVIKSYAVDSFTIKGKAESEKVIIAGSKFLPIGGRMKLTAPDVNLYLVTGYLFNLELKLDLLKLREEIALYKEGNFIEIEEEVEEKEKKDEKQGDLFHQGEPGEDSEDNFAEHAI